MKKLWILIILALVLVGCSKSEVSYKGNLFQSDLLAVTMDKDTWGYVNSKGETVIDFQFDQASAFYDGQAIVVIGDDYQIINTKGDTILDQGYEYLYRDETSGLLLFIENDKWGMINEKGKVILEPTYQRLEPFGDGLSKVSIDDTYGYINEKGEVVIDLIYKSARKFNQGYAVVQDSLNRYGLIDLKGNIVIDFIYNQLSDVDESGNIIGMVGSGETVSYDLIAVESKEVLLDNYKLIHSNSLIGTGKLYVVIKDQHKMLYDHEGHRFNDKTYAYLATLGDYLIAFEEIDDEASEPFIDLRAYTLFNEDGTEIVTRPFIGTDALAYEKDGEYLFVLASRDGDDMVIYGLEKTYRLETYQVRSITDQLFIVYREGYYGAYDREEQLVLEFEYHDLKAFEDGYILFKKGNLYGFMNDAYEIVVDLTYERYNLNINVLHVYN